ncbi:MAG TPA: recombinase family protein [Microbacteriaceae bacterium]|jgi:hypothetical protein|nr:recombinase family protein [Microbacteriaceae bacterium]
MDPNVIEATVEEIRETYGSGLRNALMVIGLAPERSNADGVLWLRSAVPDATQLERQLRQLTDYCETNDLTPRLAVVGGGISGVAPIELRPDLAVVREAAWEGCTWVAVVDAQRISRSAVEGASALALLRERHMRVVGPWVVSTE